MPLPHLQKASLLDSDQASSLEERRELRIKERTALRRMRNGVRDFPKSEQRARHVAMCWFATLPTKELTAVFEAAKQTLEKR